MQKQLRILVLSSYPQSYSGNMGGDLVERLESIGHSVTWGYEGIEEQYKKVDDYKKQKQKETSNLSLIKKIYSKSKILFYKYVLKKDSSFFFLVEDEEHPQMVAPLDVNKINGNYDIIYILFTSYMISAKTIKELYDKFHCVIIAGSIDMYHLTGGCYYTKNCKNYRNECRYCPAFDLFHKNQAHRNYLYKKKVYESTNFTFSCNSWIKRIADESGIMEGANIGIKSYTLNGDVFKPLDRNQCRIDLGIPINIKTILFARYSSQKRKGFDYVVDALNNYFKDKSQQERCDNLLLLVGEDNKSIEEKLPIPVKNLGRIPIELLIKAYNTADVFISSSIDDAGPSMVNQSMACGTPVISFEIGTALDVLFEGVSGFEAKLESQEGFNRCFEKFFAMTEEERNGMRKKTREIALKFNSRKVANEYVERIYNMRGGE